MDFKDICKPFLIYFIYSILIIIYYYNSDVYKNLKDFSLKYLKLTENKNSINKLKNNNNIYNYIYYYLSSNAIMFTILFVLCQFKYIKTAWIISIVSIITHYIIIIGLNYFINKYGEPILKRIEIERK
jgi:hypothetical protein